MTESILAPTRPRVNANPPNGAKNLGWSCPYSPRNPNARAERRLRGAAPRLRAAALRKKLPKTVPMTRHAPNPNALAAALAALTLVLAPCEAAFAQGAPTTTPATPPASGAAPRTPKQGAAPAATAATEVLGFRLPLLREGSMVSRVHGDITLDPGERHWLFRPLKPEAGNLRREFVLLPSPTLEEMLRTTQLSPSPVEFEVSGRVFIYKGRNYLLPEFAPPIIRFDAKSGGAPSANASVETAPNGVSKFVSPADAEGRPVTDADDAAVEDLERKLVERVGRAPMERLTESLESREARIAQERDLPAPGARIVHRAGKIVRDPQAGSWRFVPEQASGVGDSSVEILPCLMLERLEFATRESDSPPMVLLSGTLTVFEGRTYLLPSSFRRAREGRGIGR